jgi:betaine reductase
MKAKKIRIVHYVNQFFGGIGGEDKAFWGPQAKEGPVGPGRAIRMALKDRGEVVGTVICGDDYFAENTEEAADEVLRLMEPYDPDAVIAGPAFHAGRYGVACGAVCQSVQNELSIPAVTGMYKENPGVDLYRRDIYIVETGDSVRAMTGAIPKMVNLLCKLASREKIGRPGEEGYFPQGLLINVKADRSGAARVVDMLLAKLRGKPFVSEVARPEYDAVEPAPHIEDLGKAVIAVITDGGLVPKGNPDKIEPKAASRFGTYSIREAETLRAGDWEVAHTGYSPIYVQQDPNRLVPIDSLRELEREGVIGKLHEKFYSTSGCASIVARCKTMGEAIAAELKSAGVSGAMLTST